MSSGFGRDGSRPDHGHRFGPGRTRFSVQPCEHRNVRWRHGRPVGLVAPTNHPCCRYTPNAVRSLEHKLLGESRASTIRGELASGRGSSRHTLVFGRSTWDRNHDAVMRIGGEAPGRRGPFSKAVSNHGLLRVAATSDRQRRLAMSCSPGSESLSCRRSPVTPLARQRQPAPRP
jgi:hypothetical protein